LESLTETVSIYFSVILKIYLKATTRARAGVKRISLYPNYEMKEDFRQIFETSSTFHSGRNRIEKWLRYAQLFLQKLVRLSVNI